MADTVRSGLYHGEKTKNQGGGVYKVVVGESVAKQHRIVVSAIIIWTKWRKAPKLEKRIKWWKLKDSKVNNKFKMNVIESGILSGQEDWQRIAKMIRSIARRELGKTSGKVSTASRRETWWWNQEVQGVPK